MGLSISSNQPTLSSTSAQQIPAALATEGVLHFATDTKLLTRRNSAGNWEAVPIGPLNTVADPQWFTSAGGNALYQQSHEIVGTTATTAAVNLPAASYGYHLRLSQTGAGVTTFSRQASDTIGTGGDTSIALAQGQVVELICLTSGVWTIIYRGELDSLAGVQALTATGTIRAGRPGRIVTFNGASGQTLTLPTARAGDQLEVVNIDTTDSVTVARAGSDTINTSLTSIVVPAGARAVFTCVSANTWRCSLRALLSTTGSGSIGSTSMQAIASLSLGPGRWAVSAKGYFDVSTGSAQTYTAEIHDGTTQQDKVQATQSTTPAAQIPFALQADLTLTATTTISLRGNSSVATGTQLMSQAKLAAIAI